jgi:hypothetical protein
MHASLLNEDLIQPGKLEMGIPFSIGAATRQLPDGRLERSRYTEVILKWV